MGKLNSAAFTGFLLCFAAIIFGILTNGGIEAIMNLIHFPSFIVTFGGAIFATMMTSDSFLDFQEGLLSFGAAFQKQEIDVYELAEKIFALSEIGRREGLLALEEAAREIEFDFLKKGITLIVDGSDPELVRDILESEMMHQEERNKKNMNFWNDMGAYGPAWGMLGTLLGLINMMKSMGTDVSAIGSGMSLAWYIDIPSVVIPLGITFFVLIASESLWNFFQGFAIVYGKKEYSEERVRNAWYAMKTVLCVIPVAGIFTLLVSVVAIIGFLSDKTLLGPNMAVAILSVFYCAIAEILLMPTAVRLHRKLL